MEEHERERLRKQWQIARSLFMLISDSMANEKMELVLLLWHNVASQLVHLRKKAIGERTPAEQRFLADLDDPDQQTGGSPRGTMTKSPREKYFAEKVPEVAARVSLSPILSPRREDAFGRTTLEVCFCACFSGPSFL